MSRLLAALALFAALPTTASAQCEDLYPASRLATNLTDVRIGGYELVSEDASGDPILLEVRASARSIDGASYFGVFAVLDLPSGLQSPDLELQFDLITPGTDTVASDTFTLEVPVARRSEVRPWLESAGSRWSMQGAEIPTYAEEVRYLDEASDLALAHRQPISGGREIFWFTASTPFLDGLVVGDVVMPMPGWPGADPYVAVNLPANEDDCLVDFPLWVEEILIGDGVNGGDIGEIGLVRAATGTSWSDLLVSATLSTLVSTAWDTDTNGPLDTVGDPLAELAQENRFCTPHTNTFDVNADGQPDMCAVGSEARRLNLEVVPGVHVAGYVRMGSVAGNAQVRWRRGLPYALSFELSGTLDSSLTVRAEGDVDYPRETVELLNLHLPLVIVPVGIDEVTLFLDWEVFAGFEGQLQGETTFGVARTDQFTMVAEWNDSGLEATGTAEGATWPVSDPRMASSVSADAQALLGMRLGASLEDSLTSSGVSAHLVGDAYAQMRVDSAQTPWWQVRSGVDLDLEASAFVAGGLLADLTVVHDLLHTTEVPAEAPVGSVPAAWGQETRWVRSLDCDPGTVSNTGVDDLAVFPDGAFASIGSSGLHTCVTRYTPEGEVVWSKRILFLAGDRGIAALPDGSVVTASKDCSSLMSFAADGAEMWRMTIDPDDGFQQAHCEVLPFTDATGASGVALISTVQLGTTRLPSVAFVHDDGTFGWMNSYATTDGGGAHGAVVTADGDLVVVGTTGAPAHSLGTADGYHTANNGGMILRLDPAGEVRWATSVNVYDLDDVAEGADGRLLATGRGNEYIYQPRHTMPVVAVDASGQLMWSMTYAEDVVFEGRTDSSLNRTPGDTGWDEGTDIVSLEDGTFAVFGESSLGNDQAAWLMRITQDGDPLWFWMHDGASEDTASCVVAVPGGVMTGGWTESLVNDDGDNRVAWMTRRGLDGGLWFAGDTGWTSRSLQPELNDSRDESHVLWHSEGGTPYADVAVPIAVTIDANTRNVVDGDAITSDISW
jgi:hypothetical protein